MPTGIYSRKLIFQRAQGKNILSVHKAGPFIEVYLDDIFIGKVYAKKPVLAPPDSECEECLHLKHHIVLLTDEEALSINLAMTPLDKATNDNDPFAPGA
jgi:hypothetical protein